MSNIFLEVIIAPDITETAKDILFKEKLGIALEKNKNEIGNDLLLKQYLEVSDPR